MHRLLTALSLAVGLLGTVATAHALEVKTSFGSFNAPDDVKVVKREEKPDKSGLAVYARPDDPKAIFIVVWNPIVSDPAKPYDVLDGAVKFGNPFDKQLTRDAARPALVGGVAGGRYEGKLPDGLRSVSYVAVHGGYRLVAWLRAPDDSPHREVMDGFAKGVEGFAWTAPAHQAPAASAAQ